MPETIVPRKIQLVARRGFERMRKYRKARAMFVREFVGQYYRNTSGLSGDEHINLIFQTIKTLVPNLVMKNPKNEVSTKYTPQRFYGELLGLAIDELQEDIKFKDVLRGWIVSAFFGWGIAKTGLASSGEMLQFGNVNIDPGQVYTKLVDLDDFVIDPACTSIEEAAFMGDLSRVPRQILLDTDGYDHDLVKKLPKSKFLTDRKVENMTKSNTSQMEMITFQDYVDVVELWVPEADALVTISDPRQITLDGYLRLTDYYGPKDGPYSLLSFTPPVPKNPLPIAPVSLWYDIHRMANRMFTKIMEQADRQKDVLVYNPAQADEAQDIVESRDGDTIASTNPKDIQVISYGGQNRGNEVMLQEMQVWYNYVSGNPDQMSGNPTPGTKGGKETATRSSILQSNANISIEDARDILYDRTSEISRKQGWYLHTDPLIDIPLTKRKTGGGQQQLFLTPEQRTGDFYRFTWKIKTRSMSRLDPAIKSKRVMEFGINVVPALINAAMVAMQMGQQFNLQRAITDLARQQGILDEVEDWFDDPEYAQKMQIMMAMGPQNPGKASANGPGSTEQNGGSPITRNVPGPAEQFNQNAQVGANDAQSINQGSY